MAIKPKNETITTDSTESPILETAPAPITLEQLLSQRYDVEKLAPVLAKNFVDQLDERFIHHVTQLLVNRPAPIDVPFVAGNFLAGVSYEN